MTSRQKSYSVAGVLFFTVKKSSVMSLSENMYTKDDHIELLIPGDSNFLIAISGGENDY